VVNSIKGDIMNNKQKPVAEVKLGACRAAIWANETTTAGTRYNVTLSRIYKDESGNWKDSTSFGRRELPLLAEIVRQSWLWILENPNHNGQGKDAEEGGTEE
jgi:hypothetical protein